MNPMMPTEPPNFDIAGLRSIFLSGVPIIRQLPLDAQRYRESELYFYREIGLLDYKTAIF